MKIDLPELCLVVLVGPSGSGKSTFARTHFRATEVLSSDFCRGLVSDNENEQKATKDAFEVLHYVAAKRLARGLLTVVDATNVQAEARKPLVELARAHHVLPVAIVLDLPERLCHERNRERPDRSFGPHVVRQQRDQLRRSVRGLSREGFRHIWTLDTPEAVTEVLIERKPLWNNRKFDHGPFDVIGDVHGCCDELEELLTQLGYSPTDAPSAGRAIWSHPEGRKALFVGDLVDRGPRIVDVLRLVRGMVAAGSALCVPGNHDVKLLKLLRGARVNLTHGLDLTHAEIEALPAEEKETFVRETAEFIDSLVSHYVLDDGKLVVAHAGLPAELHGRSSGRVREFAMFGDTTGEVDEHGYPIRRDWAAAYRGEARVVYGHTPVLHPEWFNRTINIDTGCAFGGRLTALRYPELELVSVPARATYAESQRFDPRPAQEGDRSQQQRHDDVLDIEDVCGKRIVETRLRGNITVQAENATAALEVMSRFGADPKWLIYLPPTMSPSETSKKEGFLEHPEEALAYYRSEGLSHVVCEEKHMGSRCVVVLCRDAAATAVRFGVSDGTAGICYTRTGRRFFDDVEMEAALLDEVRGAMDRSGLWDELASDWVCLDCELMPWSAKAQALLTGQYAPVGAASRTALGAAVAALQQGVANGLDLGPLAERFQERARLSERYTEAYSRYCWNVASAADLKLAPFHILASESDVHTDRDHTWHMETLHKLCAHGSGILLATPYRVVELADEEACQATCDWWTALTESGGEGMVVKPLPFIATGRKGLSQPAVKCRGREYLRIIYGPEYTLPENLERLRKRGLGAKRALALREFALGVEALGRFVQREPLRRVHECVFGVLALESEPVDPRL